MNSVVLLPLTELPHCAASPIKTSMACIAQKALCFTNKTSPFPCAVGKIQRRSREMQDEPSVWEFLRSPLCYPAPRTFPRHIHSSNKSEQNRAAAADWIGDHNPTQTNTAADGPVGFSLKRFSLVLITR